MLGHHRCGIWVSNPDASERAEIELTTHGAVSALRRPVTLGSDDVPYGELPAADVPKRCDGQVKRALQQILRRHWLQLPWWKPSC